MSKYPIRRSFMIALRSVRCLSLKAIPASFYAYATPHHKTILSTGSVWDASYDLGFLGFHSFIKNIQNVSINI